MKGKYQVAHKNQKIQEGRKIKSYNLNIFNFIACLGIHEETLEIDEKFSVDGRGNFGVEK